MIWGSVDVEMPDFEMICERKENFSYELRSYNKRFVIETTHEGDDTSESFWKLAKYIGVRYKPHNKGSKEISSDKDSLIEGKGEKIPMTAPVAMAKQEDGNRTMQFVLPAKYDDINNIPVPTDGSVVVK